MKSKQVTEMEHPKGVPMSDQQRLDAVAEILATIAARRIRKEQAKRKIDSGMPTK